MTKVLIANDVVHLKLTKIRMYMCIAIYICTAYTYVPTLLYML